MKDQQAIIDKQCKAMAEEIEQLRAFVAAFEDEWDNWDYNWFNNISLRHRWQQLKEQHGLKEQGE
jgi:hypothetical protein